MAEEVLQSEAPQNGEGIFEY
jgi:hypothetical protein